jgi:hypothetical protein
MVPLQDLVQKNTVEETAKGEAKEGTPDEPGPHANFPSSPAVAPPEPAEVHARARSGPRLRHREHQTGKQRLLRGPTARISYSPVGGGVPCLLVLLPFAFVPAAELVPVPLSPPVAPPLPLLLLP